ncbi:MAG: ribonuclease P protein component [Planctomycetes bacterium]|jgi:ribonuclease P protein component|nr:ribonuclease P protein component [Planctomycetota bacterium]
MKSARDFARAYRQGSRARGALLRVVVVPNGLEHTRLGLSVGRSVWRHAVRRNRVRRLFREAFRLERHALPPGIDVVLIPAEKALEPTLERTRRELVGLVGKAWRRYGEKNPAERA